MDNLSIHFAWVKAHNNNLGNEIADQLAKEPASGIDGKTAYSRIPKSVMIKAIQEKSELQWHSKWNVTTKGEITKTFFPDIGLRLFKRLRMCVKLATIVTGHGKLRSYYHRLKIKGDRNMFAEWDHRPLIIYYGNANI